MNLKADIYQFAFTFSSPMVLNAMIFIQILLLYYYDTANAELVCPIGSLSK